MMLLRLVRKELICLLRAKQWPIAVVLFAFVLVVVSSFAFRQVGYGQAELRALTPGSLWTVFLFCAVVSLNYSFLSEDEYGALQGLLLTPCDPALIILSKLICNWIFLWLVQLLVLIIHTALFGAEILQHFWQMAAVGGLVSFGCVALGTLFASISISVRGRELVLPVLLFPCILPQVAAGVTLTNNIITPAGTIESFWLLLALCFDVISLTLSLLLFEYVVRD